MKEVIRSKCVQLDTQDLLTIINNMKPVRFGCHDNQLTPATALNYDEENCQFVCGPRSRRYWSILDFQRSRKRG